MLSSDLDLVHKWGHAYSIISIISFPKKNLLFAGTQDSKVLVFTLYTYELIQTIKLGGDYETNTRSSVLCLERSIDENYLFSAGADSLVRIWSVYNTDETRGAVQIEEVATVYSVTDIGDIFSLTYLDSLQTLVFGCQNASMMYLDNVFDRLLYDQTESPCDINRLPHRRYDKFFDSSGPTGQPENRQLAQDEFHKSALQDGAMNRILEIPSENIINYAHNGFIYSICKLCLKCSSFLSNNKTNELNHTHLHEYELNFTCSEQSEISECIITGGGDGISKLWLFTKNGRGVVSIASMGTNLNNEETVLAQATEFPFLYCGLSEGTVKIWDLTTKQLISTLHTPERSDIISVSVYQDHIFAINEGGITLFHEKEVIHWNQHQGKMLSSDVFERHVDQSETQMSLLTGGNDGSLSLWDLSSVLHLSLNEIKTQNMEFQRRKSIATARGDSVKPDTEEMLETLRVLIAIQSVSQTPDTVEQLASRRCATYLQKLLSKLGATRAHCFPLESGHNPVVYASFKGTGENKKRILWYGHYDVIPAADINRWTSDPFTLTCENGYMKGRGVSDNKGPLVAAMHSVATLLKNGELYNDVVFIIEGSEEIGSPGLDIVCEKNRDLIGNIDWIFLSNSTWVDQDHPCLNYGLRGVINAKVTVWSDLPDRHSGVDGGMHKETTADLFSLISKLQDDEGKVLIPNFYTPLKKISPEDYRRLEEIVELTEFGKNITVEELIKNWTKPSLSVTTMAMSGPGNLTVIPKSATVGLSIRLVPEQGVEKVKSALIGHIEDCFQKLSSPNHLEISIENSAEAWLGDPTNQAYQILRKQMTATWGTEPLFVKEGGSVPCVRTLERIFNAPAVQIPCGQSTDNGHLDNENLRIKNWSNMAEVICNVFRRLQ